MLRDVRPPTPTRRAILFGLVGAGLATVLSACGGGKATQTADSVFATNAARNTQAAGGASSTTGAATGTPAATASQTAATAAVTASVATSGEVATPAATTGPTPTHITGVGPLPKPLPTQGGTPPTVVGAPTRAAVAVGSSPSASATPAPAARITITANRAYDPPQVTVNKGDTIQWMNAGRSPQTVTDDPARAADRKNTLLPTGAQPWDSGVLGGGAQFTKVFDVPGEYVYFSIPAEGQGLVGRITVKG